MNAALKSIWSDMSTEELFAEYRLRPDDALRWEIVMRYTGVIKNIALQIQGVYSSFAQLDDIINEGLIVLAKAVDKYDPAVGKFETYVAKRIRGMIIDLARQQDWVPGPSAGAPKRSSAPTRSFTARWAVSPRSRKPRST